jgi:hypothetical protein
LPAGSAVEGFALEVLASGVPLVCTQEGVEGLDLEEETDYLSGATDQELAEGVCRVLREATMAAELSLAGRQAARRHAQPPADFAGWLRRMTLMPPRSAEPSPVQKARAA